MTIFDVKEWLSTGVNVISKNRMHEVLALAKPWVFVITPDFSTRNNIPEHVEITNSSYAELSSVVQDVEGEIFLTEKQVWVHIWNRIQLGEVYYVLKTPGVSPFYFVYRTWGIIQYINTSKILKILSPQIESILSDRIVFFVLDEGFEENRRWPYDKQWFRKPEWYGSDDYSRPLPKLNKIEPLISTDRDHTRYIDTPRIWWKEEFRIINTIDIQKPRK